MCWDPESIDYHKIPGPFSLFSEFEHPLKLLDCCRVLWSLSSGHTIINVNSIYTGQFSFFPKVKETRIEPRPLETNPNQLLIQLLIPGWWRVIQPVNVSTDLYQGVLGNPGDSPFWKTGVEGSVPLWQITCRQECSFDVSQRHAPAKR